MNYGLKLPVQWLRSNKHSLNEAKTKLITFRSPRLQLPRDPDIRINNYRPKLHHFAIGNKQTDNICSKLSRANKRISKLRNFLPRNL